jgi:hypothetical protein
MLGDPRWILSVLDDLKAYAAENCRSEISIHLERVQHQIKPYLSDCPPEWTLDAERQVASDLIDDLVEHAASRELSDACLHLLAAKRLLLRHEDKTIMNAKVISFPVLKRRLDF